MVNTEIPKHYTASPSSLSGTPYLTINHGATFDLDSSNAFEGPEKLLEVWFAQSAASLPPAAKPLGLKQVPRSTWTEMLDLVHCRVLSIIESDHVDAYLLSESSLFVYPHKIVLKTCGITTLLSGIPKMLEIAALEAGFPHTPAFPEKGLTAAAATHRVFYSRKNYLYPDQQRGPHRSWRDEVKALDRLFKRGSAYMIGKMNGEHWYLYITEPQSIFTPPLTPEHEKDGSDQAETPSKVVEMSEKMASLVATGAAKDDGEDETLEILMTDLDEERAKVFYLDHASTLAEERWVHSNDRLKNGVRRFSASEYDVFGQCGPEAASEDCMPEQLTTEGHALGSVVSDICGLADVYPQSKYPDARIDAYIFTPCGFSANGVIPAPRQLTNGDGANGNDTTKSSNGSTNYFTVHVTPEPQCSYASFETNVPAKQTGREAAEVVEQVVNIFRPGRFSVTLFETKGAKTPDRGYSRMDGIKGYRRVDRIVHDLDGYDLVFRHFERYDWAGGAPRLGEDI